MHGDGMIRARHSLRATLHKKPLDGVHNAICSPATDTAPDMRSSFAPLALALLGAPRALAATNYSATCTQIAAAISNASAVYLPGACTAPAGLPH